MEHRKERGVPYQVNPHLFFFIQGQKFIIWDYERHKQWVVERDYINALGKVVEQQSVSLTILTDLVKAGIVTRTPHDTIPWGWDIVSKIYHFTSSNVFKDVKKSKRQFVQEYIAMSTKLPAKSVEEEKVFCDYVFEHTFHESMDLVSVGSTFRNRKTTRCFDGSSMDYKTLGQLLYASCGEIHTTWCDLEEEGYVPDRRRRSFPSGGGLYPIRYCVLVINVDGIKPGVYEYLPEANGLKKIRSLQTHGIYERLSHCMNSQFFCEGIAAGIFFIPDFAKEWIKYPHSRSYRDVFMDIAHCSQNVLLAATAMRLRTWITAAFQDEPLREFLGIEEPLTYPAEFIGLGYGENHTLPKAFRKVRRRRVG